MLADKIVCVSHRQCEIILKRIPKIKNKAEVIYNPPPPIPTINKRVSEEPTLIYAGGASYIKGFQTLIKALTKILRKHEAKAYIILGKAYPKEKASVMKLAREVNGRLIPLDKLPHNEYLKLHEHAWALLYPSISEEPLPYVIVEAMLIGTVPIASRVGGVPEVVEGAAAERFLFKPGNVEEFISKIESLVSLSKDEVTDIGVKLKEKASKLFDKGRIEREITDSFMSILS
jgi:glycosyltransferase involved in cell wall biosynthesis